MSESERIRPWVEQIARRDLEARKELLRFARSISDKAWSLPSPLDGWTCRDVLAHLAGDTGKWFEHILGSVLHDEPLDAAKFGPGADIDLLNTLDIDARRSHAVSELLAEIESDGRKHDEMLSSMTDDHEHHLLAPYSASLGEFLSGKEAGNRGGHDREHMANIQAALRGTQ